MLLITTPISQLEILFLTDGASDNVCVCDYRSYFEGMIKTGPSVVRQETEETVEGTAFGLYLMHNANVLGH